MQTISGIGNRVTVMHWTSAPCVRQLNCCHMLSFNCSSEKKRARFCPHHFLHNRFFCCFFFLFFHFVRRTIATGHQLNGLSIYGKRVNDSRCSLQSNIKIQDKYYEMCDWIMGSIERIFSVDEFTPRMFNVNDHINFKLILSISNI